MTIGNLKHCSGGLAEGDGGVNENRNTSPRSLGMSSGEGGQHVMSAVVAGSRQLLMTFLSLLHLGLQL